jgi:hemerythrin
MLEWNEKFEVGHTVIDTQHRMLISYINRLEELAQHPCPEPGDRELFLRFVNFLEDYILMHFGVEEDRMKRFRCAAHKENSQAHSEFVDFYRSFSRRLQGLDCPPEMMQELHGACSAWVKGHILRIDTQLRQCHAPCVSGNEEN